MTFESFNGEIDGSVKKDFYGVVVKLNLLEKNTLDLKVIL